MNSFFNQEIEIKTTDLISRLALQWKAILITAIVTSLVFGGLKYYKDNNDYIRQKKDANEISRISTLPEEKQIEEILLPFSDSEKEAIISVSLLQDWIEMQNEKLSNSLVMQTDPTSQRTLLLEYSIENTDESNAEKIAKDYKMFVYDDEVINQLKPLFGDNTETKYISELINYPFSDERAAQLSDADSISISIILLDDTDAEKVEEVITKAMEKHSINVQSSLGPHSILRIGSEVAFIQNQKAIDARNNMYGSINSLKTIFENEKNRLTGAQQTALARIFEVKTKGNELEAGGIADGEIPSIPEPSIDKKYLMMGFALGIIFYIAVYAVALVFKGCIGNASDVEKITETRSIGEVFYPNQSKGVRRLLHSKIIENCLYKDRLVSDVHIQKIVDATESLCNHSNTHKLTVIKMTDKGNEIISAIGENVIALHVIDAANGFEEGELLKENAGVIIAGNRTKAASLGRIARTCQDYGMDLLGNIYIEEL